MNDKLLTPKETADFLKVSVNYLFLDRQQKTRKVPHIKLSNRIVRYRESELERVLKERSF